MLRFCLKHNQIQQRRRPRNGLGKCNQKSFIIIQNNSSCFRLFVFYEIQWIWSESLVETLWFNRALWNKWNENEFIIGFISKRLWATLIEWLVRCARISFVAFNLVISSSSSSSIFFYSFQLSIFTSHWRVTQRAAFFNNK